MILIDTNYLVEFFLPPNDARSERRHTQATSLISAIQRAEVDAIVSEVVLHECYYVLGMRLKVMDSATFAAAFKSILTYPGWAIGSDEIAILTRGLDILNAHPRLEFSDAVIAARAEAHNADLATFDQRLADAYDGAIWTTG